MLSQVVTGVCRGLTPIQSNGRTVLGTCQKRKENVHVLCFSSLINWDLYLSSCIQALSLLLLTLFHFLAHWWTELGHSSLNYVSFSKQLSHRTLCSFLLGNCFFPYCQDTVELFSLPLGIDANSNPLLYRLQIAFITGRLKNSRGSLMSHKLQLHWPWSAALQCFWDLNTFCANLWPFVKTIDSLEQLRLWTIFHVCFDLFGALY